MSFGEVVGDAFSWLSTEFQKSLEDPLPDPIPIRHKPASIQFTAKNALTSWQATLGDVDRDFAKDDFDDFRQNWADRIIFPADKDLNRSLFLCAGDICGVEVDAISCLTNESFFSPHDLSGRLLSLCGERLRDQLVNLDRCRAGEARIVKAYGIPASHIIYSMGPRFSTKYITATHNSLNSCLRETMMLMLEEKLTSIAFQCIPFRDSSFPTGASLQTKSLSHCETDTLSQYQSSSSQFMSRYLPHHDELMRKTTSADEIDAASSSLPSTDAGGLPLYQYEPYCGSGIHYKDPYKDKGGEGSEEDEVTQRDQRCNENGFSCGLVDENVSYNPSKQKRGDPSYHYATHAHASPPRSSSPPEDPPKPPSLLYANKVDIAHTTLRTLRRWMIKMRNNIDTVVLVAKNQQELNIYKEILYIYFPRDDVEQYYSVVNSPMETGNENGEIEVSERRVRIGMTPLVTAIRIDDHRDDGNDESHDRSVSSSLPRAFPTPSSSKTLLESTASDSLSQSISLSSSSIRSFGVREEEDDDENDKLIDASDISFTCARDFTETERRYRAYQQNEAIKREKLVSSLSLSSSSTPALTSPQSYVASLLSSSSSSAPQSANAVISSSSGPFDSKSLLANANALLTQTSDFLRYHLLEDDISPRSSPPSPSSSSAYSWIDKLYPQSPSQATESSHQCISNPKTINDGSIPKENKKEITPAQKDDSSAVCTTRSFNQTLKRCFDDGDKAEA